MTVPRRPLQTLMVVQDASSAAGGRTGKRAAARGTRTGLAGIGVVALVMLLASSQAGFRSRPLQLAGGGEKPDAELQSKFEEIYAGRAWGPHGNGSGTGSTVAATSGIREILWNAIHDLEVDSLIDVPCGAMAWMPLLLERVQQERPHFRYLGMDIAHSVVKTNKRVFRDKTGWRFATFDLSSQPLPRGYDLIHTRDALQHLSCTTIVRALRNLARSNARYLLVGSYDAVNNTNIRDGAYFPLNLRQPPFSLTRPLGVLPEGPGPSGRPKFMLLYSIPELRNENFGAMMLRCSYTPVCSKAWCG